MDEKNPICVNPTLLFTRLAAIAQRDKNVEQYFEYEFTHRPLSLFKNELMRKPDKSSLRNVLLAVEMDRPTMEPAVKYVLDGGASLHRVHWVKGMKFCEIAVEYVYYVRRNYGAVCIVFDRYNKEKSIKSNEHARRAL